MNYIQIAFTFDEAKSDESSEILIALLAEMPFESFEETENGLKAFMPASHYNQDETASRIKDIQNTLDFTFEITEIEDQNWNKKWESNYDPVLIDEKCYIRAPFHDPKPGVDYEIIIEPKMSFGTAHHETTSMMISYVLENEWSGLSVLDMGCGTGVLAILASMKGAENLVAIDNDEWAYGNTLENLERNNITNTLALKGGKEAIPQQKFDVILANINRNILLDQMQNYGNSLLPKARLVMSGFYEEDLPVIRESAAKQNLKFTDYKTKNSWCAAAFEKE